MIFIYSYTAHRYKVQASIAQKQKDAQAKSTTAPTLPFSAMGKVGPSLVQDGSATSSNMQQIATMEREIERWRSSYEQAIAENEHLRSRGEDASQVAHWRQLYEASEREKNIATERLRQITELGSKSDTSEAVLREKYLALKDEFQVCE